MTEAQKRRLGKVIMMTVSGLAGVSLALAGVNGLVELSRPRSPSSAVLVLLAGMPDRMGVLGVRGNGWTPVDVASLYVILAGLCRWVMFFAGIAELYMDTWVY